MLVKTFQNSWKERHRQELIDLAHNVFSKEVTKINKLPSMKWHEEDETLYVYLLCPNEKNRKIILFFEEMIVHWLTPDQPLNLLSSRNLVFRLSDQTQPLFFIELLLEIPDEKSIQLIHHQLPDIAKEIQLGVLSSGHAKHILKMKRLSLEGKTSFIYESLVSLMRRRPKRFNDQVFFTLQYFLSHSKEEFCNIRDARHLCRIICAHYLFEKGVERETKAFPHRRHLCMKLMNTELQYPFGQKKVLGLAFTLNSLKDYECFELKHILRAIHRILPDAQYQADSYYFHKSENGLLSIYLEIEYIEATEQQILKKKLPQELKNSIEYLTPSLFALRNEEELIKNIINLSNELKYVRDQPQVMISFGEQRGEVLKFDVILTRVLMKKHRTLKEMSRRLPADVHFIPQRIANVGTLRKKYVKEANVFSLEIENRRFSRKNQPFDLIKARKHVVQAIKKILGEFHDYNGDLLHKQNEQLEMIQRELGKEWKAYDHHLERLFYALTPSLMLDTLEVKNLCTLFLETLEMELPHNEDYLLQIKQSETSLAIVIKAKTYEIKDRFTDALRKDLSRFCSGFIDIDNHYYLCYLYPNLSTKETQLLISTLEELRKKGEETQVLHLHLPRAAQSLDPRLGVDRTSGIFLNMLYEGLMRINAQGEPEPAIAKSVSISEDGKHYLFKLRESCWSNGARLTSYDFEYAWKKILEPDFRSPYSFLFFPIKNAEAIKRGEKPISQLGIRSVDSHTLSIELEYPAPYFLSLTANWLYSPLCREIDQKHPGWAYHSGESYVCNGPFKLEVWKFNDDLQVVKNPYYWEFDTVKLDRIQISIIEDEEVALKMFARGELDWHGDPLTKIPLSEISRLKEANALLSKSSCYGYYWFQFNQERFPFQSPKIRKAFAYGINREKLINDVLQSHDEPLYGLLSKTPFDQERAVELFEEGLKELGVERENLPPLVVTHSDIEEHEKVTFEVGSQWEKLFGIKIKYERQAWDTYFETLNRGDFVIGGIVWYRRIEDPIYFFNLFIPRAYTVRVSRWKNSQYIQLVEQANRTIEQKERDKLLTQAEQIFLDEMPAIPLVRQEFRYAKNPRLQGYILSNTNQIDFRTAYFE